MFVTSDLHLSQSVSKPMDVFGGNWENYTQKIIDGFSNLVKPGDTTVIAGDISWGMNLAEAMADFKLIDSFPGEKIILKGNHDYWWETVKKTNDAFAQNGISTIKILNNNAFLYEDIAICGTRGWFVENAEDEKIYKRELGRLETSLKEGRELSPKHMYCFIHYPPITRKNVQQEVMELFDKYNVTRCFYGHIHSAGQNQAVEGVQKNIDFKLVSCDFNDFEPFLIKK